MRNFRFVFVALMLFVPFLYACQEGTDVVESGTYTGTIQEVEPEKTEIYVKTDDGKVLELYFRESTTLTRNGETVSFEQLEEGGKVEVEIEKEGNRLNPIAVRILE
jgi:cold shock protein